MTLPDLPVSDRCTAELTRLHLDEVQAPLDFGRVFGNDRDVELEVGVGKGRFLMLAATAMPDRNFVGVEYARRYLERAIARIGKRGLANVRLVHAEALAFLERFVAEKSVRAVHIYFPDPWPKKRHHKRRLIRPAVMTELARVMRSGASLRVVTDHDDYAAVIREVLSADGRFCTASEDRLEWKLPGMDRLIGPGVTNFEIKYRREGRSFHRFAVQRI
ncbi:MAG: tRNA (guanosine(46)-N7)-methyltransferase TrmB [Acidobacteriota bacterium]|nr:MAG: tRNA (guanosine(46)-N7)-methyltransferase TrmB [Acidobacteriota bacterium]